MTSREEMGQKFDEVGGEQESLAPDAAVDLGFRDAMRRLAGTVCVVTVALDGERHGTTATAVTSLSMAPPSLIVCFNRDSRLHALLCAADRFCVNILHSDDVEMSRLFSSPVTSSQRFADQRWTTPPEGAPALENAQASIQCFKDNQVDYGSHTIFIGRVTSILNREVIAPLVYCNGSYSGAVPLSQKS